MSTKCTNSSVRLKIYGIIGAGLTLIIPFFLKLGNNDNHLETDQSFCPFKMVTGFPCPGCGITKSLVYLYQGDLVKSVKYHLFGPFAALFCFFAIVVLSMELSTGKAYFNKWFYSARVAYGLGAVLLVYHLLRLLYFIQTNSIDSILHESIWR